MAARTLRPRHQEEIKAKIQTSQLINLLQNHALGDSVNELKPSQLDAAKFLLNKTLSNAPTEVAQTTQLTGEMKVYGWEE
jgi:hypothetical protein